MNADGEEGEDGNKRGKLQEGGSSGSGGAGDWWNEEGFGKSYEPFNPMEYEEEEQSRGQKRVATDAPEGEEERIARGEGGDMHMGWLHEARGEQ